MAKLKGKARAQYRKQQAQARASAKQDFHKHIKRDPFLDLYTQQQKQCMAHPNGGVIHTTFGHLSPKQVITDTAIAYEAVFEDSNGEYTFSIYKTAGGYRIVADGIEMVKQHIDNILWDFEVQLSVYGPRVLGGRTYHLDGGMTTIIQPKRQEETA